ncbi:MAG: aminoglycoside phosphotransferase family protein [Bacteroides sp.]|nr:aminoglycoside phosphotransferase family protein [Bacteroides sp.]
MEDLFNIVSKFKTYGTPAVVKPLGNGLIHDTFKVTTAELNSPDYVLQRINHALFPDIDTLQRNLVYITNHLRGKLPASDPDIDRKVLTFIPTIQGKRYWTDGAAYWRMTKYIPFSQTIETVTPETAYTAGKAFGHFQAMLSDLPVQLEETLPDLYNMEFHLRQLKDARENNRDRRRRKVCKELDYIERYAADMCKAEIAHRAGKLSKRICHGDPRISNLLFDQNEEALCVIDLDTVMPGYVFSDFGNFLRTAANTGKEEERDQDEVYFDMRIFCAFTKGYLASSMSFLTAYEIANLPFAATLFPYMQGVRFLTDFLNGDSYYQIQYPEHNLIRARTQLRLHESATEQLLHMQEFIHQHLLQ